jgi:hypothetical protein
MTDDQALQTKIAHLSMIQGVIARMAGDGQSMKTLGITISAATIAIAPIGGSSAIILAVTALIALLFFWWQTAYHLHVERAYRCLYDHVRENKAVPAFTMDWRSYRADIHSPRKLAFSASVLIPFLGMFVVLLALIFITLSQSVRTPSDRGNANGTATEQT